MKPKDSIYKDLQVGCHEIRLLHIEPLQYGAPTQTPLSLNFQTLVIKDEDCSNILVEAVQGLISCAIQFSCLVPADWNLSLKKTTDEQATKFTDTITTIVLRVVQRRYADFRDGLDKITTFSQSWEDDFAVQGKGAIFAHRLAPADAFFEDMSQHPDVQFDNRYDREVDMAISEAAYGLRTKLKLDGIAPTGLMKKVSAVLPNGIATKLLPKNLDRVGAALVEHFPRLIFETFQDILSDKNAAIPTGWSSSSLQKQVFEVLAPYTRRLPPRDEMTGNSLEGQRLAQTLTKLQNCCERVAKCFRTLSIPPFIALSYTWGDKNDKVPIRIGGRPANITRNLFDALRAIQNERTLNGMPVWADALCIDQDDKEEVIREIKRMVQVYREASRIIVWLGKIPDTCDLHGITPSVDLKSIPPLQEADIRAVNGASSQIRQRTYNKILSCLALFQMPYWNRTWIFQELMAAHLGSIFFFWDKLHPIRRLIDAIMVFRYIQFPQSPVNPRPTRSASHLLADDAVETYWKCCQSAAEAARRLSSIELATQEHAAEPRDGIQEDYWIKLLVDRSLHSEAEKPQDLVYGLLGIQPKGLQALVEPDYDRPKERVFADFTVALVQYKGLDFLFSAMFMPAGAQPSWIINHQITEGTILSFGLAFAWHDSKAGGKGNPHVRFTNDTYQMHCWGALVDQLNPCKNASRSKHRLGASRMIDHIFRSHTISPEEMNRNAFPFLVFHTLNMLALGGLQLEDWLENHTSVEIEGVKAQDFIPRGVDRHELEKKMGLLFRRRVVLTEQGRLAFVPRDSQLGDQIFIFPSCNMPIVVRKLGERYRIVGPCYVEGIMFGEASVHADWQEITIV
ncbi:hypothetical protein BP6252_13193 [Coleophoma cylindrospora]|uniref:Heterokaryon incompatibility domain-containing protein n=1 Tax=Coleophoma cylindrospora TaxID=1849047 RepID=A0A3D8QAL3_9HELO|nr:hypothetical protein BP6252_13193 [Coleophoma cylindrospora]